MSETTISAAIGGILALIYLLSTGFAFGRGLLKGFFEPWRTLLGAGVSLSLLSILGSIIYYLTDVTLSLLVVELVVVAGLSIMAAYRSGKLGKMGKLGKIEILDAILFLLGIISLGAWWTAMLTHPVTEAVRTPWEILSPFSLIALAVPFALSIIMTHRRGDARADRGVGPCMYGKILFVLTLFSGLSMAAILYPLGFGFDPFLHRATVDHIAQFGTITPKPLYYIGQYALELLGTKVFQLPLFSLDVFLAPLLAALLLPAAIFGIRRVSIGADPYGAIAALAILPFAAFVSTTPQALSFIFLGVTVFLLAPVIRGNNADADKRVGIGADPYGAAAIFAVAALFMHPLSGAMAVLYVILVALRNHRAAFMGTLVLMSVTLPLAFAAQAVKAGLPIGLSWPSAISVPLSAYLSTDFNAWGDVAYFITANLFIAIVIASVVLFFKKTDRSLASAVPLLAAGAALVNFLILSLFFDFSFLISYERTGFALRALTIASIFLLPYIAMIKIDKNAGPAHGPAPTYEPAPTRGSMIFAGFISVIFIANIYSAYPRHDGYARSAAFNVEASDFAAVDLIDKTAGSDDYVVLANQATSSAAIQTFGFKKYYHGDIYFYPVPTGGLLYELFLEMNEQPSLETIEKVRALTGASTVFYAVSDYWWQADSIIENTKALLPKTDLLQTGKTTVFVFPKP
jgi:hypothetical protein